MEVSTYEQTIKELLKAITLIWKVIMMGDMNLPLRLCYLKDEVQSYLRLGSKINNIELITNKGDKQ